MARKKIPDAILTELFTLSARRCALCFCLEADFKEKSGQVAHLDQDNSNDSLNNLVWLCLEHHDKYDSKTSQTKNYTKNELISYRARLYEEVKNFNARNSVPSENSDHQVIERALSSLFEYIPYSRLLIFLDGFPEFFPLDLIGSLETWDLFKKSNPHIYPFSDSSLNEKLDKFFHSQGRLEWLSGASYEKINLFVSRLDLRGTNHNLALNPELPVDVSNKVIAEANIIKNEYEICYKDLTSYIRNKYKNVSLNSWKKN